MITPIPTRLTDLYMIVEVTYHNDTTSVQFSEFKSLERYLLQWITKPIHLGVRFVSLTEQLRNFPQIHDFLASAIKAQRARSNSEWSISVLGFDEQSHYIDVAA